MAVHFHSLTVKKVHKETPECVVITFDVPEPLKDLFQFVHGQSVTLKKNLGGESIRRSYSICSAPHENTLCVAVKKCIDGKFSTYVNAHLKKGDRIDVLPPTGRFNTPLNKANKKKYLAIAAGSGITPIISIIKTALATEPASSFTLVYGNRTRGSIIFFEELEGLKNRYLARFNFINILSRERTEAPVNFGRINTEKLHELTKLVDYRAIDETFICGPHEMLVLVKEFLEQLGVNQQKIHYELFATPGSVSAPITQLPHPESSGPKSNVAIQLDGRVFDFDLPFNSESILDAALKHGADLPFACKGGVCCTCRAKLTEGEVRMDVNYALEADEIAKGFILTCQSHPVTDKVVINFDLR